MQFRADMHIHSVLSPCGDIEMSPSAIVAQAKAKGLGSYAVCAESLIREKAKAEGTLGGPVAGSLLAEEDALRAQLR